MENKKLEITRRKFLTNSTYSGLITLGSTSMITSCMRLNTANNQKYSNQELTKSIILRPYQLLCATCLIGEEKTVEDIDEIKLIRENPDIPVTLVCHAGELFDYQDPVLIGDIDENFVFNRKRDLEILQRIDLFPGVTLPARFILHRMWDRIESVSGICDCGEIVSKTCFGCTKSKSGLYEKGREISLKYVVPYDDDQIDFSEHDLVKAKAKHPILIPRTKEERAKAKMKSLEAMYKAERIRVRPHILLCAVCQYGDGVRPPFSGDNLPEMIEFILQKPETKIEIVEAADWMMCGSCTVFNKYDKCVNVKGHGSLTSQLRDVRLLQVLELNYGDIINAHELYQRILTRIISTVPICGTISKGVESPSVWDDRCGHHSENIPMYAKGRPLLAKKFGVEIL